jgi:hypothetical protein
MFKNGHYIPWWGEMNKALATIMCAEIDRFLKPQGETQRSVSKDWSIRIGLAQVDPDGTETERQVLQLLSNWQIAYFRSMSPAYRERRDTPEFRARVNRELISVCEVYFELFDALVVRQNHLPSTAVPKLRHDPRDVPPPPQQRSFGTVQPPHRRRASLSQIHGGNTDWQIVGTQQATFGGSAAQTSTRESGYESVLPPTPYADRIPSTSSNDQFGGLQEADRERAGTTTTPHTHLPSPNSAINANTELPMKDFYHPAISNGLQQGENVDVSKPKVRAQLKTAEGLFVHSAPDDPGMSRRVSAVGQPVITTRAAAGYDGVSMVDTPLDSNHRFSQHHVFSPVNVADMKNDCYHERDDITAVEPPAMMNDTSHQQGGMPTFDAAGTTDHLSPEPSIINPDAVWITQNVVREFLLQHGHADLFAGDPCGLAANAEKKWEYDAALAAALDDENAHGKFSTPDSVVFMPTGNEALSALYPGSPVSGSPVPGSTTDNVHHQRRVGTLGSAREVDLIDPKDGFGTEYGLPRVGGPQADVEDRLDRLIARNRETRAAAKARAHSEEQITTSGSDTRAAGAAQANRPSASSVEQDAASGAQIPRVRGSSGGSHGAAHTPPTVGGVRRRRQRRK